MWNWGGTHHVWSRVLLWQNLAGLVRRDDEVRDDGNGLDLLRPGELDVVANAVWRLWWPLASVFTPCWGRKHFTERNLCAGGILRGQRLEVSSDEAAKECGTDIVGMSLYIKKLTSADPVVQL
jgi:hypothetical protein